MSPDNEDTTLYTQGEHSSTAKWVREQQAKLKPNPFPPDPRLLEVIEGKQSRRETILANLCFIAVGLFLLAVMTIVLTGGGR